MRDDTGIFSGEEKLVGHIETDSGGILLADSLWEDRLPLTAQSRVALDLGLERCRIPVYSVLRNEKRYLIVAIDDALVPSPGLENVDTEDQVVVPKNEDENTEEGMPPTPRREDDEDEEDDNG